MSSDEEEGGKAAPGMAISSILFERRHADSDFSLERSSVVMSGFLTKKSRGRTLIGKIFSSSKNRWFELRVDDNGLQIAYTLLYFQNPGDDKPKGHIRLSPFDTISQDDEDYRSFTINFATDSSTNHKSLTITADSSAIAQKWVDVMKDSITTLNRLTIILESAEEEAESSSQKRELARQTIAAARKAAISNAPRPLVLTGSQYDDEAGSAASHPDHLADGGAAGSSSAAMQLMGPPGSKRAAVLNFFTHGFSGGGGGDASDKGTRTPLSWGTVTGNAGASTNGRVLMHAILHQWPGDEGEEVDASTRYSLQMGSWRPLEHKSPEVAAEENTLKNGGGEGKSQGKGDAHATEDLRVEVERLQSGGSGKVSPKTVKFRQDE